MITFKKARPLLGVLVREGNGGTWDCIRPFSQCVWKEWGLTVVKLATRNC